MDANDEINNQTEKQNNDKSQLSVVVNQPTTKPKYTKEQILKSYKKIMKKIHPDVSPELTRLASIVNEA